MLPQHAAEFSTVSDVLVRESLRSDLAAISDALNAEDRKKADATWGFDKKTLTVALPRTVIAKLNSLKYVLVTLGE